MATMRLSLWSWADRGHKSVAADSPKARKVIHEAFKRSGGPTPELRRIYREYLDYKRAKGLAAKG
jgi:hypothetical protein